MLLTFDSHSTHIFDYNQFYSTLILFIIHNTYILSDYPKDSSKNKNKKQKNKNKNKFSLNLNWKLDKMV